MVDACTKLLGRIDILHNNVGIGAGDRGPTNMTEEVWDRIHTTNLKSVMFTCKHVLPVMRAQRSGVIINISSIAAVCSVGIVAYKTSKAAVNAFTQSLAIGNGEYNIRANVIMPGLMNTPMAIEGYVAAGRDREELIAQRDCAGAAGADDGNRLGRRECGVVPGERRGALHHRRVPCGRWRPVGADRLTLAARLRADRAHPSQSPRVSAPGASTHWLSVR